MMSPLSVAQFLPPGDIHFDLVVMDEASQIRPEDALGSLARVESAVIVGDPKQLPPTAFFDSGIAEDDEQEETTLDESESVLDVFLKQFPFRRLRWHYRSQHESLIQFSNEKFYDNDLIVLPARQRESRGFGVHFNYIAEPNYLKGRNRAEAEEVVKQVARHIRNFPEKSLGVVAMGKKQADEIHLQLENVRRRDPSLDRAIVDFCPEEPLFIKNLENVQGDERDVIFMSCTYGPETPGARVMQRFGPINSDVGWRRLNVIATRAKQRVEVFSSMRAGDIVVGPGTRRGVIALRDYLDYANNGMAAVGIGPMGDTESPFEQAVGDLLTRMGYQWHAQVGVAGFFIDLGIVNPRRPGEYLLGIECDGATYHSPQSVRDRDRLRQEILESKGWNIHRIWSTSWYRNRAIEIERLENAIQAVLAADDHSVALDVSEDEAEDETIVEEAISEFEDSAPQRDLDNLRHALNRFWEENIQPVFPDRQSSILSIPVVARLTESRPISDEEWFEAIPMDMRQQINPEEGVFKADILELIEEFI